jgi:hypothetical protein
VGCLWLTILGGLAETGGLILVAVEIARIRHRELPGGTRWLRRTWNRLRGKPTLTDLAGRVSEGSSKDKGRLKVVAAPKILLEDRLARVERQFENLDRDVDAL